MRIRRLVVLSVFLPLLAAGQSGPGRRWWRTVQFLAGDKLEGRAPGSDGYRKAAEYVAAAYKQDGLKPGGASGYFQPVRFRVRRIVEEQSSLALTRGSVQEILRLGDDAGFSLRVDPAGNLQAQMVFAGYGLTVPELDYDDLAGLDLKGKVVLFLSGGPPSIPGPLRAHYQSSSERWRFLRRAGAVGTAVIPNPKSMDIPWERAKLARLRPSMSLMDEKLDPTPGQRLSLVINPDRADKFLEGTNHTMAEILALADAGKPLPRFPLSASLYAGAAVDRSETESVNVIGILEGSDPKLKDEYVVVSAHLDHLGAGRPVNGDSIYNGAMDNASGVASLLEVAASLRGARPKRSVLFLALTAEENGLLGSKYFTAYPTVKAAQMAAGINLDMFLPLHSLRILNAYGLEESTLGPQLRKVAARYGVRIQGDPEPERNLFIRSDQYNFIRLGVPALAFKFGFRTGSPEERIQKKWLKERYHAPSDDADQPVNLAGAARFNRLIAALVGQLAGSTERPRWNANSFFRRYAR